MHNSRGINRPSRKGRGWARALVHALALFMVPVMLVTLPGAAEAAPVFGNPASASWNTDEAPGSSTKGGGGARCNVTAVWIVDALQGPGASGNGYQVSFEFSCSTGWNVSDSYLGMYPEGDGCDVAAPADRMQFDGGSMSGTVVVGMASSCQVTEVCYEFGASTFSNPWSVGTAADCVTLDLGQPPTADFPQSCQAGTVNKPGVGPQKAHPTDTRFQKVRDIVTNVSGAANPGDWRTYVILQAPTLNGYTSFTNSTRTFPAGVSQTANTHSVMFAPYAGGAFPQTRLAYEQSRVDRPDVWNYSVVGVGVIHIPTYVTATGAGSTASAGGHLYLPQEAVPPYIGYAGLSKPGLCAFYWGTKIASTSADDFDEPLGDLNPASGTTEPPDTTPAPPPPAEAGCTFEFSDPTTWLEGGICAVVGLLAAIFDLLGNILGAIVGLVADLASALGDLLRTLFIPSPDAWGLDGLRNQWDNRGPGQVAGEISAGVGGVADGYSGGGGCGSLADFSNDDISANVTCTQVKDSAGMAALYGLVQAGLIALTCWGIWHIVVGSIKADA